MARDHCGAPGCPRHLVYKRTGHNRIYSLYCQDHTCEWSANTSGEFCSQQRDSTAKCCPGHGKCRIRDCIHQAPRAVSWDDLPWICPQREYIFMTCLSQCYRFGGLNNANFSAVPDKRSRNGAEQSDTSAGTTETTGRGTGKNEARRGS